VNWHLSVGHKDRPRLNSRKKHFDSLAIKKCAAISPLQILIEHLEIFIFVSMVNTPEFSDRLLDQQFLAESDSP